MTVETLNANIINAQGSWLGEIADIAEAIADADGFTIFTIVDNDTVDLGLDDSVVEDADTVNTVTIKVHARSISGGKDQLAVDLLIGGVVQGTQQNTGNLTGSFVTYTLTDAGWDSDWTAAELDGMEARFTAETTGMPHTPDTDIDCIDVDIDYTAAGGGDPDILFQRKRTNILLRM